jgi:hypothetical protein
MIGSFVGTFVTKLVCKADSVRLEMGAHWLSTVTGRWISGGDQWYCSKWLASAIEDEKPFCLDVFYQAVI